MKLALNSQLLTVQILTNYVQVLILRLSYVITTVAKLNLNSYLDWTLKLTLVSLAVLKSMK